MVEQLKPCPFCGGEAIVTEHNGGFAAIGCSCGKCRIHPHAFGFPSVEYAAEAWNRRAERTCRNLNPPSCRDFECSECGESSEFAPGFMPSYCPHCGARVIKEES